MERLQNETQQDYRKRIKVNKLVVNNMLKGRWFWISEYYGLELRPVFGQTNGTYVSPKTDKKLSFTENIRNEKGYSEYLCKRPKTV